MWQPIETAPKDGTDVLLFYPTFNRKAWVGSYDKHESITNGKRNYFHEGWNIGGAMSFFPSPKEEPAPTHWMPIPADPGSC